MVNMAARWLMITTVLLLVISAEARPAVVSNKVVRCDRDRCATPKCHMGQNLVQLPDSCCLECAGDEGHECFYNGLRIPSGSEHRQGCMVCRCAFGRLACMYPSCNALNCARRNYVLTQDQCCPGCGS